MPVKDQEYHTTIAPPESTPTLDLGGTFVPTPSVYGIKAPGLIQIFVVVAVFLIIALLFLGEFLHEHGLGWIFRGISIFAVLVVFGVGLFAIKKVRKQSDRLREMLNIDRTTGLYSSVYLMEELDRLVDKGPGNLVLIFLDLDELKYYNDKYGHRAGDTLIRESAEALAEAIAGCGVGFRYGGDEFVALLNDVTPADALKIAKRVHASFENREISASMGVYPWRPGLSPDDLLDKADKAMYNAKRAGKGRISFGGAEEDPIADIIDSDVIT